VENELFIQLDKFFRRERFFSIKCLQGVNARRQLAQIKASFSRLVCEDP